METILYSTHAVSLMSFPRSYKGHSTSTVAINIICQQKFFLLTLVPIRSIKTKLLTLVKDQRQREKYENISLKVREILVAIHISDKYQQLVN